MTQLALFGPGAPSVPVPIHNAVPKAARPRLSGQQAAILARLQRGRVANTELTTIALRYSARLHELTQAGFYWEKFDEDHASGVVWYRLK